MYWWTSLQWQRQSSIKTINLEFDCVRLAKHLGEFDYVWLLNSIQINGTNEIILRSFTECSIGCAGIEGKWDYGLHFTLPIPCTHTSPSLPWCLLPLCSFFFYVAGYHTVTGIKLLNLGGRWVGGGGWWGWAVLLSFPNPNPISDQNMQFSGTLSSQTWPLKFILESIPILRLSDGNGSNLYSVSDHNGSKTTPSCAAHTYIHIPYIG